MYGKVFPNAQVTGIELAGPYVRFCRQWAEDMEEDVANVEIYQGNAEDLSMYEDDTFDIVSWTYVLHEMPGENAKKIVDEIFR